MYIYPKHESDNTIDRRYSVNLEYCGYSYPLYIVYFDGEKIGACRDELDANHVMTCHWNERQQTLKGV